MKRIALGCLALLCLSLPLIQTAHAIQLKPRENPDTNLWGYVNAKGELALEERFTLAGEFTSGGIAPVMDKDKGFAWIDTKGEIVAKPFIFDNWPDEFREGLARYVEGDKYGFIDNTGRKAIPARFLWVEPFQDGHAVFCEGCKKVMYGEHWAMEGGLWGCIDHSGKVTTPPQKTLDSDNPCK